MEKIFTYLKSLKFLILILILGFGILPGFAIRAGVLYANEKMAVEGLASEVTGQAKLLSTQIMAYDYLANPVSKAIDAQVNQLSAIYDGRVILIDPSYRIVQDSYLLDENKIILSKDVISAFEGSTVQNYAKESGYIEQFIPLIKENEETVSGVMIISASTDSILMAQESLGHWLMVMQLILVAVVIFAALVLSVHLTNPLKKLTKSITDVKEGYEADFKEINTYTETARISDACGEMLTRLQTLDSSRQDFVSNVSHELKTPLTSMKVLADSLVGQDDVPADLYREFMTDIAAEIDRENKIINDLLSLVKLDKSAGTLNIESMNINDLLELLMKRLRPIAQKQNVELVLESFRPVVAEVDEVKLTLALSNLIENGIKYNQPEGWVHVSLNADHQNFFVTVADNGLGIPEEAQEHIFERFYRVDKSHSREIGGTGLGLAIARNAVIMHRGAIKVHSVPEEGTTFTVRIPLNYISN